MKVFWVLISIFIFSLAESGPLYAQSSTTAEKSLIESSREDDDWSAYKDRIKIGFELEMVSRRFLFILPYIDLEESGLIEPMRSQLTTEELDTYLDLDPRLAEGFPDSVRNFLTNGLSLAPPRLILPERRMPEAPPLKLLGPDGEEFSNEIAGPRGLFLDEQSLQNSPGENSSEASQESVIRYDQVLLRPEDELSVLRARWRSLSPETKRELVNVNKFPRRLQAELIIRSLKIKEWTRFAFHESTPHDLVRVFNSLQWSRDLEAIEVSSFLPHRDLNAFFRQRDAIVEVVRLEGRLQDRPEDTALTAAPYHYHLSVPGADLKEHAKALNRLLLLRGLRAGYFPEIFDSQQQVAYKDEVSNKGLLRLIGKERVEFRFHPGNLDEDLKDYLRWFFTDADAAVREIDTLARSLVRKEEAAQLAMHAPEVLRHLVPPDEILNLLSLEDLGAAAAIHLSNITTLFPTTSELRGGRYSDDQLFAIFLENEPYLITEYFSRAEIRARLTPFLSDPRLTKEPDCFALMKSLSAL